MATRNYIKGADLPDLPIEWLDGDGDLINFSTGWTFSALIGLTSQTALFTKTAGFTGAATSPNLTVAWPATGELNDLPAGKAYRMVITAKRDADNKERKMSLSLFIDATVEP